jgi:hypothetical protein
LPALATALVRLAHLSPAEWAAVTEAGRRGIESRHDARIVARAVEGIYAEARELACVRPE